MRYHILGRSVTTSDGKDFYLGQLDAAEYLGPKVRQIIQPRLKAVEPFDKQFSGSARVPYQRPHRNNIIRVGRGSTRGAAKIKTRAAEAFGAGKPLEIVEVDLAGPKAGEVLVEIKATGLCHTDEFTRSGDDPEGASWDISWVARCTYTASEYYLPFRVGTLTDRSTYAKCPEG